MSRSNVISKAVHLTLLAAAVGATTPAIGQEVETEVETIVVTGSRIASSLDSPSPLQVLGAQDIEQSGVANIQDLLLKTPAFGSPSVSRTNSNFSTASAGVATVDLRNLGISRTLVLVNGRRYVAGIPGESAVDMNTIPTQFIERVDVLTGGASAVYGSDAVAGVVNIVYKKNFEGVELDFQSGSSNRGDSEETTASLTMGTNVAEGKGNIIAHLGYSDQGAVYSRDRAATKIDQNSLAARDKKAGSASDFFTAIRPYYSSYAPSGLFYTGAGSAYTVDEAGKQSCWSTNGNATCDATGFNRSAFRTIAIPTERYLAAVSGNYEIAESHSAFMEATYASTQATTVLEPFALASDDIYPSTGGQVPIEFPVFVDNGNGTYTRTLVRNPVVPQFAYDQAADEDGDGSKDIWFGRRLAEIGNRGNVADRDTFRLVGGMQGKLFDNTWDYEAFYSYGQTKESQTSSGQVNVLNFKNALEAVPDVGDVDGDGNKTEAICLSPDARAQGCVPINVFGAGSITPEAAKYVAAPGMLSTFTSQKLAGLNVSGEPLDLWAGPLGVAFGAEYREEYARSEFDALQQAGLNAGNAIPSTEGDFNVLEEYLEVNLPLLDGVPFADSLDFRGAIRFSDYSSIGNTQSWNAGLEWSPIPSLRFRAIRAESVRAPNINELYSPPSQDYPNGLADPCKGVTATSTGPNDAACRAAPGVMENIQANGAFTLNQADDQGISGYNRGNPNLQEEQGKSWTFGVVIQPTDIAVLENFGFSVDYFDIEIDDAIVSTPRQFILNQCYSGDASFCQFITRRPTAVGLNSAGSLEFIDSAVTNSGGLGTEGIDLSVTYNQQVGPGDFRARLSYTHLLDGYVVPAAGSEPDPFAGEVGASDNRAYLQLGYNWGNVGITWNVNYIGKAYLDDQFLATITDTRVAGGKTKWAPESVGVDAVTYHDVQLTWSPGEKTELYFGVSNLFDEGAPKIISGLPGDDTGTETDAGTYDAIGQRFYAGFRSKF